MNDMSADIVSLINDLASPDNNTQLRAENRLIRIGEPAIEPVIEAARHPNPQVRWRAAFVLGEIGDRRGYSVVLDMLHDEDAAARAAAVDAVAKIGGADAIEPLAKVVLDAQRDDHAASHAAWALGRLEELALQALLEVWQEGDAAARREVVYPLAEIGDPTAIEPLAERLDDPDLCLDVADALGMLGDARGLDILIDHLCNKWKKDDSEHDYTHGLVGLGKAAVNCLIDVTYRSSGEVKEKAVWLMGEIGDTSAIDRLTELLDDADVDREALYALGKCGDERVLPRLLELVYEADDDWDIDISLVVSKFGEMVIPQLETVANNGGKYPREVVACTLGDISSDRSIDILECMLEDSDSAVREWVLDSLGEIGMDDPPRFGQRCAELVETRLDDPTRKVHARAASWSCSLRKELGQPLKPLAVSLFDLY